MRPVLNTTDEQRVVVVEDAEGDAIVASPGDSPRLRTESVRLASSLGGSVS